MNDFPTSKNCRIGLALGGGGARGFAHLGVIKALRELEIPIYCVAGTSIGSIVGGIVAADMFQRAVDWVQDPDWIKLPLLFGKLHVPWRSVLASERIESFLRDMICVKTFAELCIPFAAVATDLYTGETIVMREGDVQSAIRASMSIPGVFEPVLRAGRVLVDGGLTNPVPVDACRAMGAGKVIAVNVNTISKGDIPQKFARLNLLDVIDQTFTVLCDHGARETFAKELPECVLCPPVGNVMMLDFRGAGKLMEAGYVHAMEHKDELLRLTQGSGEVLPC